MLAATTSQLLSQKRELAQRPKAQDRPPHDLPFLHRPQYAAVLADTAVVAQDVILAATQRDLVHTGQLPLRILRVGLVHLAVVDVDSSMVEAHLHPVAAAVTGFHHPGRPRPHSQHALHETLLYGLVRL